MQTSPLMLPPLVRVKPGALSRIAVYLRRAQLSHAFVMVSEGLPESFQAALAHSLTAEHIEVSLNTSVKEGSFEVAVQLFESAPQRVDAVVGVGGGRALDVAKYVAFLLRKPFFSVPTSLSNDGFCSPQSSLTMRGLRRSLPSALPYGVVVDTQVCLTAPRALWYSGIGDLAAKLTAVADWKLAFHRRGVQINDLAALLSDATVMQFIARPELDLEGLRLLATALLLNGIAIQIAGSSRPASGAEHLISHALDTISKRQRLHGLQVGVAAYLVSLLQGGGHSERIARLFADTGFWGEIARDPFQRDEWVAAVKIAPTLKDDFYTILSDRDCTSDVLRYIQEDRWLPQCFL